jgi:hypothetical protein
MWVDGAVIFLCTDWRHFDEMSVATRPFFNKLKDMVVWANTNTSQGSLYRSQHQLIAVYVAGKASSVKTFRLGERRRYRTNVWTYPGVKRFGQNGDPTRSVDLTVKPVALVVDALRDCSKRGESVLDPFADLGTTMIAAERTSRRARLIEVDPIFLRRDRAPRSKLAAFVPTAAGSEPCRPIQRRLWQAAPQEPVQEGKIGQPERQA